MTGRNLNKLARNIRRPGIWSNTLPRARLAPNAAPMQLLACSQSVGLHQFGVRIPRCHLSTTSNLHIVKPMVEPNKSVPAEITESQYHEIADEYLETIVNKFEELQDEGEDLDVEFSAGVLTLKFPFGTYVVNKQPPNKQIWLSSPKSGPKRYDWVVIGDGQQHKEGTGHGEWIYIKDGTTINALFEDETGIDLTMPIAHLGG